MPFATVIKAVKIRDDFLWRRVSVQRWDQKDRRHGFTACFLSGDPERSNIASAKIDSDQLSLLVFPLRFSLVDDLNSGLVARLRMRGEHKVVMFNVFRTIRE